MDEFDQNSGDQTKRVNVRRVKSSGSSHRTRPGGFRFTIPSMRSPAGCLWLIPAVIVGLFTMGCAGVLGLLIALGAGISHVIDIITGKTGSSD